MPIALDASEHPLKSVTIFQSSTAEIKRDFTVQLKAGTNVLEIRNISTQVDHESARIHGLGNDARVVDMACKIAPGSGKGDTYAHSSISAEKKKLSAQLKLLEAERAVCRKEYELLDDVARSLAGDKGTAFGAFMQEYASRKRSAMSSAVRLDEQIDALTREIQELTHDHKGTTAAVVTATVLAKHDCQIELQLTYLVTGVSWTPYYDLHAATSDGKPSSTVSLHYCAHITQATGEDWGNATLTLSTANSHALRSLAVPTVDPLQFVVTAGAPPAETDNGRPSYGPQMHTRSALDSIHRPMSAQQPPAPAQLFQHRPPPQQAQGVQSTAPHALHGQLDFLYPRPGAAPAAQKSPPGVETYDDPDLAQEAAGQGAVPDRSPLSLAYRVEGPVALPSDGAAHKVSIAVLAFEAALRHVCVPRKAAAAFIEADIQNTSAFELLAGPVSVFMDDRFVTRTAFGLIGVNARFVCVLGVDAALKVAYRATARTVHEPPRAFAERAKTSTRTAVTTVSSGHAFDIPALVVRDAVPRGNTELGIAVALLKPAGLAQARDGEEVAVALPGRAAGAAPADVRARWTTVENGEGGEKEGLFEWLCGVRAGQTIRLEAEWEVRAPSSVRLEERVYARDGGAK